MPEARRQYIAGNWKMYKTSAGAREYVQRLLARLPMGNGVELALCVPFTALAATVDALGGSDVHVLAQNMHQEPEGAFTGEISAPMIAELGVNGVLLGHSERRQHFNETDRALAEKVPAALEAGLQPMLCVGESEEEHEAGDTQRKLRHQVQEALEKVPDARLHEVVIAYEPIWAIGTGKVATPEHAQDAIGFIRALVGDRSEEAAQRVRVLYGGSVKPENAADMLGRPDIDGALVGGASLDPDGLVEIVKAAAAAR
jgi:triosephosphate isomerase (TIM)